MKTRFCLLVALVAAAFVFASCPNEDDKLPAFRGTVRLNMLDEDNGQTLLGDSRVYIERGNNCYGLSCLMADLSRRRGAGDIQWHEQRGLAPRVEMPPGHSYMVYDTWTVVEFPPGMLAVGSVYYRVYVHTQGPVRATATRSFRPSTGTYRRGSRRPAGRKPQAMPATIEPSPHLLDFAAAVCSMVDWTSIAVSWNWT